MIRASLGMVHAVKFVLLLCPSCTTLFIRLCNWRKAAITACHRHKMQVRSGYLFILVGSAGEMVSALTTGALVNGPLYIFVMVSSRVLFPCRACLPNFT